MSLFRRSKANKTPAPKERDVVEPVYVPTKSSVTAAPAKTNELATAKETVEQISNELKISADNQQVSFKRLAGILKTIDKMEAGLRHMSRLESKAASLDNELKLTKKKYLQKENWSNEQERKLQNLTKQHTELRKKFEISQGEILARVDREGGHVEQMARQAEKIKGLNAILAERDDHINTLTMTNTNLQEDVSAQSVALSQQSNRFAELEKSLEIVSLNLDSKTKQNDQLMSELGTLRLDHNELKSQYFEKVSALEHAQYDLKTQRTVLDEGMKRRDEEAYALKTRIEQLNAQVRIKENMSSHLDEEIISLRAAVDSERERYERMERRFREKSADADSATDAVMRTKADYEELAAKFNAAIHELDAARRLNHVQKHKLERYASITALVGTGSEFANSAGGLIGGTGERESESADYGRLEETPNTASNADTSSNLDTSEEAIRNLSGRFEL